MSANFVTILTTAHLLVVALGDGAFAERLWGRQGWEESWLSVGRVHRRQVERVAGRHGLFPMEHFDQQVAVRKS